MTTHQRQTQFQDGRGNGMEGTVAPPCFADLDQIENQRTWDSTLVVLDPRALGRDCLVRSLAGQGIRMEVAAFGSMQEWRCVEDLHPQLSAILFNIGGRRITDQDMRDELTRICSEYNSVPVILLADCDEISQILKALECGARGYIPTTVGIGVCVAAIGLAIAGGVFVPANSARAVQHLADSSPAAPQDISRMFTPRQASVVDALRRGKANKIIAYELNLCESTVKVHVRNIMRKVKATNRTEVAYRINDMMRPDHQFESAN
jgi:DNA-binding NarL/FixJ family response regulator